MRHFIEATRNSVGQANWYAAIATALTMPDICGRLEQPNARSQERFVSWFDRYMLPRYQYRLGPLKTVRTFLSGRDCYALRCAFLHQGEFDIDAQRANEILERFCFTAPSKKIIKHLNLINGKTLQLQVDRFCLEVCDAVERWLHDVSTSQDIQARVEQLGLIR